MSVVYLAWHRELNRLVAIKILQQFSNPSAILLTRLRTEAEALARLRHPNIVAIHDIGIHDRQPYLVLEYVDGGPLHHYMRERQLSTRHAATITRILAKAVAHAHQLGVIHRDLKPENVLIQKTPDEDSGPDSELPFPGVLKLADFGLAKIVAHQSVTLDRAVLGTPSYLSPEQAAGGTITPSSDVYSLGAILYALLTGRPPFMEETVLGTIRQITTAEPLSPSLLRSGIPRDLEVICLKCLEKEPSRRYANAEQLAQDLQRFLEGHPVMARPLGWAGRANRWIQRRPLMASLLSLLVLTIVTSLIGISLLYLQAEREREEALASQQLAELAQRRLQESLSDQNAIALFLTRELPEAARPRPGLPPAESLKFKDALSSLAEKIPERFRISPASRPNWSNRSVSVSDNWASLNQPKNTLLGHSSYSRRWGRITRKILKTSRTVSRCFTIYKGQVIKPCTFRNCFWKAGCISWVLTTPIR